MRNKYEVISALGATLLLYCFLLAQRRQAMA